MRSRAISAPPTASSPSMCSSRAAGLRRLTACVCSCPAMRADGWSSTRVIRESRRHHPPRPTSPRQRESRAPPSRQPPPPPRQTSPRQTSPRQTSPTARSSTKRSKMAAVVSRGCASSWRVSHPDQQGMSRRVAAGGSPHRYGRASEPHSAEADKSKGVESISTDGGGCDRSSGR